MAERDFNLEMTGEQVKDALQQLEDRVAEGWAVGEKDGTPVTSGSPYYENNAKYYAGQAENAATRAESAVPAGVDSAVLFTQAQQLTTAQQEQARQNIKAGGSNPNLIMNPWFTVNQRGFTSTSSNNTMTVDRWFAQNMRTTGVCSWSDGVITLDATNAVGGGVTFTQYADIADLTGKQVTLSVMLADGSIYSATGTLVARGASQVLHMYVDLGTLGSFRLYINSTTAETPYNLLFVITQGKTISIKAAKLELGSVSTLANDAPPNYAEELAKCQRYFVRLITQSNSGYTPIGLAYVSTATTVTAFINIPHNMRPIVSVAMGGTFRAYKVDSSGNYLISAISKGAQNTNVVAIACTVSSATVGEMVFIQSASDTGAYIDLSADL